MDYCCATGNCPRCQYEVKRRQAIRDLLAKIDEMNAEPSTPEQWDAKCKEIYATPGEVWLGVITMLRQQVPVRR